MTTLERVARVLELHRIAGGWTDDGVAEAVLRELRLDETSVSVGVTTHTDMADRFDRA